MQSTRAIKPIPCKYCGADIIYNPDTHSFHNWGGDRDGLKHIDKRTGNIIESTSANVTKILEEVVTLRSEIDRLRSSHWQAHQKLDRVLQLVSSQAVDIREDHE